MFKKTPLVRLSPKKANNEAYLLQEIQRWFLKSVLIAGGKPEYPANRKKSMHCTQFYKM